MSGGSYGYLFCKETCELFNYSNIRTLEEMESRFLGLGYDDIAKDFRRLIEYIKSANNRVEVLGNQLNNLMHDIEWYDSADIGKDSLAKSVEEYRTKQLADGTDSGHRKEIELKKRPMNEMISRFNRTVSEMDMSMQDKMTMLGMVTAIYQRYCEDTQQPLTETTKEGIEKQ